jgi:hypothetical protein
MKLRSKLPVALSVLAALASALAPASSARQADSRSISIKAEDGREVRLYDKSYALVVGVSDYTSGWPKLPGVKKDVEEVARALERQGFQVTVVENPDSAQLDKSFKSFIEEHGLGVENRLLFYFAGHGHTIKQSYGEEMGYIVPSDAPNPNSDRAGFMSKAMDMQQMELYARRIQSKHALFLFDSCFSGAIFALSRAVPDAISYKTARPVRQFITSGSADEQVPDQSIFRRQFVEAIEGEADSNHDGYVTGTELGEFLQDKVVNYSKNTQHPQYGKIRNANLDKGDFVFALPKAPKPPSSAANTNPAPMQPARVDPVAIELAFWDAIKNSTDPEDFKEYLKKYPAGQFKGIAQRRLTALANSTTTAPAASASDTTSTPLTPESRNIFVPFDNVNGLRPGHSTESDIKPILGPPQSIEKLSGRDFRVFKYPREGISVGVNETDIIDFIYVETPYDGKTPEGLYIGMPEQQAKAILKLSFVQGMSESFYSKIGRVEETRNGFQVWFEGNKLIRMKAFR